MCKNTWAKVHFFVILFWFCHAFPKAFSGKRRMDGMVISAGHVTHNALESLRNGT